MLDLLISEPMQEMEVPRYLVHCEKRLAEEYLRCDVYLESGTRRPLIDVVESCLIERHIGKSSQHPYVQFDILSMCKVCCKMLQLQLLSCYQFFVGAILQKGFHALMVEDRPEDLLRLYQCASWF